MIHEPALYLPNQRYCLVAQLVHTLEVHTTRDRKLVTRQVVSEQSSGPVDYKYTLD